MPYNKDKFLDQISFVETMQKILIWLFLLFCCYANAQNNNNIYEQNFDDIIKLATNNDVKAQFDLASMYYSGKGVPQDYKQSFYWYSKAADNNHVGAQAMLAIMYYKGQGVEQDVKKAQEYFKLAGLEGNVLRYFIQEFTQDKN